MKTGSLQIIGTRKCQLTRKAERFFRERGRTFHFVDLTERALSRGELQAICAAAGLRAAELVDGTGAEFQKRGLAYMDYDALEQMIGHPLLMRTPIVRYGRRAVVGEDVNAWLEIAKDSF